MRCRFLLCATIVLMIALAGGVMAADGVANKPDERLAQKVSIRMTNARLHTVLEELSRQSGIVIYCGSSKNDWQVRDIPVVVCAKDMALGTLLKAIAESTHLLFSSDRVDDVRTYRIWRDKKRQSELAEYGDKLQKWNIANAEWEWNAARMVKDIPDGELAKLNPSLLKCFPAREISMFFAALGPDVLQRALAGEDVRIRMSQAPSEIKEAFIGAMDGFRRVHNLDSSTPRSEPSEEENLAVESFNVRYWDGANGESDLSSNFCGADFGFGGPHFDSLASLAEKAKGVELPKRPERPTAPASLKNDFTPKFWETKIDLEAPKDKGQYEIELADLWADVSDATGYALVAENFHGHQMTLSKASYGKGLTPKIVAEYKTGRVPGFDVGDAWRVDESAKVMIGSDVLWTCDHTALMPEAQMTALKTKLDGDGLDFDDIVSLIGYTQPQITQWISMSRDFGSLALPDPNDPNSPLWSLYAGLSTSQRTALRSDKGLALDDAQSKAMVERVGSWLGDGEGVLTFKTAKLTKGAIKTTGQMQQYSYSFSIDGTRDGEKTDYGVTLGCTFPIYSEKRKQELMAGKG